MISKPPFDVVVSQYGPSVLRVCRSMLDPADAEDAWSETFLSALSAYPQLPADANTQAWLITIAHRKVIDIVRARARRAVPTAELGEAAVPAGGAGGGIAGADTRDLDLINALARLPTRQKHAVVYHYLAGLAYREVAAILGGSEDAARRAAADAIAALRRSYPGSTTTNRATTERATSKKATTKKPLPKETPHDPEHALDCAPRYDTAHAPDCAPRPDTARRPDTA